MPQICPPSEISETTQIRRQERVDRREETEVGMEREERVERKK